MELRIWVQIKHQDGTDVGAEEIEEWADMWRSG